MADDVGQKRVSRGTGSATPNPKAAGPQRLRNFGPPTCAHTVYSISMGVGTNFGVGVEEARPHVPRMGVGFLGRGQPAPPHQLGHLRERCKFPQRVRGGAPAAEGFSCILCRQIAFPSISVRVAYSLHG